MSTFPSPLISGIHQALAPFERQGGLLSSTPDEAVDLFPTSAHPCPERYCSQVLTTQIGFAHPSFKWPLVQLGVQAQAQCERCGRSSGSLKALPAPWGSPGPLLEGERGNNRQSPSPTPTQPPSTLLLADGHH